MKNKNDRNNDKKKKPKILAWVLLNQTKRKNIKVMTDKIQEAEHDNIPRKQIRTKIKSTEKSFSHSVMVTKQH